MPDKGNAENEDILGKDVSNGWFTHNVGKATEDPLEEVTVIPTHPAGPPCWRRTRGEKLKCHRCGAQLADVMVKIPNPVVEGAFGIARYASCPGCGLRGIAEAMPLPEEEIDEIMRRHEDESIPALGEELETPDDQG